MSPLNVMLILCCNVVMSNTFTVNGVYHIALLCCLWLSHSHSLLVSMNAELSACVMVQEQE
jgi:hypothetical protein